MGIFSRFRRMLKSNVNSMISKSENPEKMLSQVIVDMNQQLIESKKSVASSIADEKRLERQLRNNKSLAKEWEDKAKLAVKAGKDDLAKEALLRKQEFDNLYNQYKPQWEVQHEAVEKLKTALRQLQQKIEEAQRKKNLLVARSKRAHAQKKIQDTVSGLSDNSAFEVFDRMTEKVERLEAENEATLEISEIENNESNLEKQFAELESGTASADLLLEELKERMIEKDETKKLN
ncbi:MAG: PspA/IM30 family protein [Spirochaetes bacterium]|nr:MAG: PspA/IM30 family protein [Spirochaetota bacterium]